MKKLIALSIIFLVGMRFLVGSIDPLFDNSLYSVWMKKGNLDKVHYSLWMNKDNLDEVKMQIDGLVKKNLGPPNIVDFRPQVSKITSLNGIEFLGYFSNAADVKLIFEYEQKRADGTILKYKGEVRLIDVMAQYYYRVRLHSSNNLSCLYAVMVHIAPVRIQSSISGQAVDTKIYILTFPEPLYN